jgi:hypothetical protein
VSLSAISASAVSMMNKLRASNKMTLQEPPTDQGAAEGQERFVDLRQPLIPDAQPTELVQPGERALHDPTILTQAAAMRRAALGQHGGDAAPSQGAAVWGGSVGTITREAVRSPARASWLTPHGRDGLDQRYQLGDIMRIRPCYEGGQGDALGVRDEVMFAPQLPSLRRIRARLRPPKTARTDDESTAARDQSRRSAPRSFTKRTAWRRRQTPARCHARRDRQQVIPEPQPSSWGSISQGLPLFTTNKMPVSTWRGAKGLRPGQRTRRGLGGGNNGSISAHNASSSNRVALCNPPNSRGDTRDIHRNQEEAQSFC